jgi:putative transposase
LGESRLSSASCPLSNPALFAQYPLSSRDAPKLLKGLQYVPRVIITDQLKSYGAAKREILPGVEHRQSRYLNNRCENSHRPTRQREYRMQGFKSAGHAQRFLSAYGPIAQHFRPRRHLLSASAYRAEMRQRFASWAEATGTERAA